MSITIHVPSPATRLVHARASRLVCMQVGFMLIDTLARHLGIHMDKLQHSAAVGRGRLCDKRVLLAKPMTFMNNSGESVGKLARYYKVRSSARSAATVAILQNTRWLFRAVTIAYRSTRRMVAAASHLAA